MQWATGVPRFRRNCDGYHPPGRGAAVELVACAECGNRYEASLGFCPRCGGTARGETANTPASPRNPARMRLQLGGLLLLLVGLLFLAGPLAILADPSPTERQMHDWWTAAQEGGQLQGGDVALVLMRDGNPVAGANVTVTAGNRTLATGQTDQAGHFNASLGPFVAVTLHVDGAFRRDALSIVPGAATTVRLDVAIDPAESEAVTGIEGFVTGVVVTILLLSLLLALGGLSALLVRWRGLALAGPLPTLAVVLLGTLIFLNAGTLALLAILAVPYALVVSGRAAFGT
jgi:hypothetical protein